MAETYSSKLPHRFAKVEKIAGGELEDCTVLEGVMFNKDITHPRMRRKIKNPRVILLDCPMEYKKGESQTNVEITKESDWELMLKQEEEEVKALCDHILSVKPDVVITEKGVSDLAQHFLLKQNVGGFFGTEDLWEFLSGHRFINSGFVDGGLTRTLEVYGGHNIRRRGL